MKTITKILIWLSGLAANKIVKYIALILVYYIVGYWVLMIISAPFRWMLP